LHSLSVKEIRANEALENTIIEVLKTIHDPEIPVDVYELGLIYEVKIKADGHVEIEMTLTSPNCPVAESMPKEVEDKVAAIDGVASAKVNIVFDPPWDKDMMSEEAKLELGFL
jgi:FeS assembly SUF system protein